MNKYIKKNANNEIIDVFFDYQKSKFDGTEIFLEDTEIKKHKVNNKSISSPSGIYIFMYVDGVVTEKEQSIIDSAELIIYKEIKISEMEIFILGKMLRWSKALVAIQAQFNNVFIVDVSSGDSFSEIDTAYDNMLAWLNE